MLFQSISHLFFLTFFLTNICKHSGGYCQKLCLFFLFSLAKKVVAGIFKKVHDVKQSEKNLVVVL